MRSGRAPLGVRAALNAGARFLLTGFTRRGAPVASIATCVHSFATSHSDKRRRSAVVVWKVRTSVVTLLAIAYKAQAGHHRLFVNIKTATSSMQQLHLLLLGCVVGWGPRK
jgi:hypothetical protein